MRDKAEWEGINRGWQAERSAMIGEVQELQANLIKA